MIPHPFGYIGVILVQQLLIVGMIWVITHLVERLREERRRLSSSGAFSNLASNTDLAALAVQLSRTGNSDADPVFTRSKTQQLQEEQV